MKYSTRNLADCPLPLPVRTKILVEFRPDGKLLDYAPMFYSKNPEADVDEIVRAKGWDKHPKYTPKDVWVDGAF